MAARRQPAESPMSQDILVEVAPIVAEMRDFRARAPADVFERQQLLLCGKHAINHILQERKVDWQPRSRELLLTGRRHVMDPDTHINLAQFCGTYFEYYRAAQRIPANARMPPCDLINGNVSTDVIQVLFASLLGYGVDVIGFARHKATDLKRLKGHLEEDNCMGAIINIDGVHWTAVSRYLDSCRKRVGGRIEKFRWAYIDSLAESIYECTDSLDELFEKYGARFAQAILIYNRPGESYYSVAAKRMEIAAGKNARGAAANIAGVYAPPVLPAAAAPARPAGAAAAAALAGAAAAANNARSYAPNNNNNARTFAPDDASVASYDPAAGASARVPVRGRAPTPGRVPVQGRAPTPGRVPVRGRAPTPGRAAAAAAAAAPKGILKKPGGRRSHKRSSHKRRSQTRRR
uniref:Uncharacterized protein n=1 Tax=viral metagenome TaxID=1070528 RepID=A0A6C0DQW1_9ZZZZ